MKAKKVKNTNREKKLFDVHVAGIYDPVTVVAVDEKEAKLLAAPKKAKTKVVERKLAPGEYAYFYGPDGDTVSVFLDGEIVFSFNDNAHVDYPEDLTWSRTLSGIFKTAFELGCRVGEKRQLEKNSTAETKTTK